MKIFMWPQNTLAPINKYPKVLIFFGAYSLITGDHVVWEMPCSSTYTSRTFSDEFSVHHPDEFKIRVPGNVAFHKSGDLKIASNKYLFYLLPYGTELNPAVSEHGSLSNEISQTEILKTLMKSVISFQQKFRETHSRTNY